VCCPPRLLDTMAEVLDAQPPSLDGLTLKDDAAKGEASSSAAAILRDMHIKEEEDEKYSLDSQTYRPQKSDDLLSFVVMVLTLLVPHCFEAFDYAKVINARNREFGQLRHLWKKLRSSGIWGPIVEAAELEDISKLEKILEIFVVL